MSETSPDGQGSGNAGNPGSVASQTAVVSTSCATNPLAAALAGAQQQQSSVDSNATFMMNSVAAATLAAVAAHAVQQMTGPQQQQQQQSSAAPASLYAALQGGHNPLFAAAAAALQPTPTAQVVPSHAALLAALTGAGQPQQQPSVPGLFQSHGPASSLLRPNGTILQHAGTPNALTSPTVLSNMHSWTAEQLEQHVVLLQQANQPVPQSVALLLSEAQRKEKKKTAKRIANRKSASTSRARKKALVEEMTKTNARLKRQAMILSLLPDLVITTSPAGEITFCSAQVERVLQYKSEDLVGAKLYTLLLPSSRDALKCLIEELTHPGKAKAARTSAVATARRKSKRRMDDQRTLGDETGTSKNTADNGNENSNASVRESAGTGDPSSQASSGAAIVSEQSFPLSVVEVESKQQGQDPKPSATNENFDTSASNSGASGEDDTGGTNSEGKPRESKQRPRSDDSSSLSSDAKNLRANDNLDRNVRWHNQRMLKGSLKDSSDYGPKDDVTGASVTANNASARLSSLKHVPEALRGGKKDVKAARYENAGDQSSSDDSLLAGVEEKKKGESASDDSGYRESNDSREETSSSGSDTSQSNDRHKKLAPTCRLCLIRDDLTTVWCEVTSSIRDRSLDDDGEEEEKTAFASSNANGNPSALKLENKELLLCLRPIRDGEKKVDESLRFRPVSMDLSTPLVRTSLICSRGVDATEQKSGSSLSSSIKHSKRPPKKRSLPTHSSDSFATNDEPPTKKQQKASKGLETEKSVVESLILMNRSSFLN